METAFKILIVALTLAVGGYLFFKPEHIYNMTLGGRGRGEGGAGGGADAGPHHRQANLIVIRSAGGFIIFIAAYVVYLWLGAR
jgi:hypothetical protein